MKKIPISKLKDDFPQMNFKWIKEIQHITEKIEKPWNFVGGVVRDSLLGIETYDIDINTLAEPEEIEAYLEGFNKCVIGKRFGTIGVFYKKWKIDITTTRADIATYGRKADVAFVTSFELDSTRRDFTINALMFNNKEIIDYHEGLLHLKNSKILFIGNAQQRIEEDYLRILRYVRFFCRFSSGYMDYKDVIIANLPGLRQISIERIISEIEGMCKKNTSKAIEILNELGVSKLIFNQPLNNLLIKEDMTKEIKITMMFLDFSKDQWKNLPIPSYAKDYLEVKESIYQDVMKDFAFYWARYHNDKRAQQFLYIYNLKNETNIVISTENNDFSWIYEHFPKEQRTKAMIAAKYCFLINYEVNLRNIKRFIVEF